MLPVPQDAKVLSALTSKYFSKEPWEQDITTISGNDKAIADYSGVALAKVPELSYLDYQIYYHDSWIANMSSSEDGRKFLETCWRLKQTDADEKAIKKFQQSGGGK